MFSARNTVDTRLTRQVRRWLTWLWLCSLLLAIVGWLPTRGQTAIPDTVVLPPVQIRLPMIIGEATDIEACPVTSSNLYATQHVRIKRESELPPRLDPDLNLLNRGYKQTAALLELININGPTDEDSPQLAHLFRPVRVPTISGVFQVYDWNWACCPGGELGEPLANPEVTLVEMTTTPGEALYPPRRNASIGQTFVALVLYAEQYRLTFTYTDEDSPVNGYLIHVENLCVDPNLLALYQEMHGAGRNDLPALLTSDSLGTAASHGVRIAVRDSGSFMDPRSGKDWWQDVVRARLAALSAHQ